MLVPVGAAEASCAPLDSLNLYCVAFLWGTPHQSCIFKSWSDKSGVSLLFNFGRAFADVST